ncbi:hypothetical protein BD779DRAFT_520454 [Infundibulicybe gibba]|nr:hypothetical protein BD779DRAFT_520454 [Infundibulicybe gibba]
MPGQVWPWAETCTTMSRTMCTSIKLTDLNYYKNPSSVASLIPPPNVRSLLICAVMNRRRSIATTTHQPRHDRYQLQETVTPLAPDLRAWVRSLARQYGASEQYLIDSCIKEHGTDGVAVAKMLADQFQQTINDWQTSNLYFTPVPVSLPQEPPHASLSLA